MKRLKASFTAILLLLVMVACSSSSPEPMRELEPPEDQVIITLDVNCDGTDIRPQLAGSIPGDESLYELYYIPSAYRNLFTRRLILFAHGYFDPYYFHPEEDGPVLPQDYHPLHSPIVCSLIQQGFAVGWTSYAHNGYAVESGYNSIKELRQDRHGSL